MRRSRRPIEDLRTAIDCLPVHTRQAMLEGVRSNEIIVGAYTDRSGGVCPMLAAHRCGGRTDFLSFARAWDRFTGAKGRARRASERELRVLTTHLEASLLSDDESSDLGHAIAEHEDLRNGRAKSAPRPGDPDRSKELRKRRGWSWLRPFRRYDEYRHALARAEEQAAEYESEPAPEAERRRQPVR
jgi:hypothetical protein